MNKIQFQSGMSLPSFQKLYGNEEQCSQAIELERWPKGFICPVCGHTRYSLISGRKHKLFQCTKCRKQTSIISGTLFQGTHLPLTLWFLAIYIISNAKSGISALSLMRHLGVSYKTAWLLQHKLMETMQERDHKYKLDGTLEIDDAYLGGENPGGKAGRGSENKVPFVVAVSLNKFNHPIYVKFDVLTDFTNESIINWVKSSVEPYSTVKSDGLACFGAVKTIGCVHKVTVAGGRKPYELPEFKWVNTVLGNLKNSISGTHHSLKFVKYANRYLGAFAYRFNRRFELSKIPNRLLNIAVNSCPKPEVWIRS